MFDRQTTVRLPGVTTCRPAVNDLEFIHSLETFQIQAGCFDHLSHIRMAYVYLCEQNMPDVIDRVREVLNGFLVHHKIEPGTKFHETLTQAWLILVSLHMQESPATQSYETFIARNQCLADSKTMQVYYSTELLFSEQARSGFVSPDRKPFPIRTESGNGSATIKTCT